MIGNSLWYLVMQSDSVSKLVLIVLLVLSVICWTIFLSKIMISFVKQQAIKRTLSYISMRSTMQDLHDYELQHPSTIVTYLIRKQESFCEIISQKNSSDDHKNALLAAHGDQLAESLVHEEQAFLVVLSTTAVIAPLLGLFGTVWGLVHAFMNIAQQHAADIATVAPGIAEALITTLVGLMVAIPAQVMYNVLIARLRRFDAQIFTLVEIITSILSTRGV